MHVLLARLITCYGPGTHELLRQMADELEWLEEGTQRSEQKRVVLELHFGRFRRELSGQMRFGNAGK